MNVDPMWGELTLAIFKQLGFLAAILFVMMLFLVFFFRVKVGGSIYCEFIENGRSRFELLKYNTQDTLGDLYEIESDHGIYHVPTKFRMLANWPPGVPQWLQETVPHDKWIMGVQSPMVLPPVENYELAAMDDLQLKKSRHAVLKTAAEELRKESAQDSIKSHSD